MVMPVSPLLANDLKPRSFFMNVLSSTKLSYAYLRIFEKNKDHIFTVAKVERHFSQGPFYSFCLRPIICNGSQINKIFVFSLYYDMCSNKHVYVYSNLLYLL